MRCSSYCITEGYNFLTKEFDPKTLGYKSQIIDKVLNLQSSDQDIFVFPFGSCIIWNASETEELNILKSLKGIQKNSLEKFHYELIDFNYGHNKDKTYIDEEKNIVYLANQDLLIKLSISYALAQGIRLKEIERSIIEILDKTKPIQEEFAKKGKVSLSKRQISKQLGLFFSTRYSVNMQSDILDTPEFFWRKPSYEPIYLMTVEFQDIKLRQGILNNHMDIICELYSVLSDELNHKHTSKLEVIIILLISLEILLALYNENVIDKLFAFFEYFT